MPSTCIADSLRQLIQWLLSRLLALRFDLTENGFNINIPPPDLIGNSLLYSWQDALS